MLIFDRVSKRFGSTQALREVSVNVEPGMVLGLVGHNGAGKSTLMRMAVGLVRPDAGRVTLGGDAVERIGNFGGLVAASFDASALPAQWSARTAVKVTAALAGVPDARVAAVLDLVGLAGAAHKKVGQFSMGMRQRLALALALVNEPRVLILDEPTNALDPVISNDLRRWVTEYAARGNSVLISSHNLQEVEQVADRIVVMHKGEVARDAATAELLDSNTVLVRVDRPEALAERLRQLAARPRGARRRAARDRRHEPVADGPVAVAAGPVPLGRFERCPGPPLARRTGAGHGRGTTGPLPLARDGLAGGGADLRGPGRDRGVAIPRVRCGLPSCLGPAHGGHARGGHRRRRRQRPRLAR